MQTLEEFEQYYESDLRPVLEGFEVRRKKICANLLWTMAGILAVMVLVVLIVPVFRRAPQFALFVLAIGVIIAIGIWWWMTKDFVRAFKGKVIAGIVRFCDPSLRYDPGQHISRSRFRGSEIFNQRIDRFKGEDYVSGTIGATKIEFSELHAQYKTTTSSGKGGTRTQWHTVFKGLFFIADFNKHFHGTAVVLPDTAERLFGFLGKKLQAMNLTRGELIKLDDPEFEKNFVVYGDDQVEARYILSTSLMRRITEFKKKTGRRIYLSFVRSNVCVAISMSRNMFEPRVFRSVLDFDLVAEYLHDLQFATGIVDDLNLNTRIWTKE